MAVALSAGYCTFLKEDLGVEVLEINAFSRHDAKLLQVILDLQNI